MLTLFPDRAPELGVPLEDPNGTLMTGFVERVGGSSALTASEGSTQDPALLLVEALDALITTAGGDASTSNITIAVPAHWEPQALRRLQDALCTHAGFVRGGTSPRLVSDSITALTALNSDDRLPVDGVVALLDFGAAGTSFTLADAAAGFTPIADTVRYPEFSGDLIDQALMVHVLERIGRTDGADPASTGVVGQFGNLREDCRLAKERLSDEMLTEVAVELPGRRTSVEVTRAELESLIEARLTRVLSAFDDMLRRNRVRRKDLAAVAMAGGVAKTPLVAQRLSAHAKTSVVTAVQPGLAMAVGAVMVSARQPIEQREDAPESTTMAAMVGASTGSFAASTGGFTASTDTLGAATGGVLFDDPSETLHQLAWSEADDSVNEPVAYTGEPYDDDARVTPSQLLQVPKFEPPPRPSRGNRLPQLVFGVAALVSMVAIGGVAFTLTSSTSHPPAPAPPSTSA
ncbi:MAG: Hsp70 family protein, partial [Mycobacterium sp.]|uniref:Hsp70 family protein n=1 Tax=Mycobacterium sp. TaxID=1785 RepID=UPI003C673567